MAERTSYEPGTPSWVDLTTPDLEASLRFYGGLFGWEFEDAGEEAGHYHQALLRGKRVAGIGPNPPGSPATTFWSTYFSGSDVDAHAKAVAEAGGQVSFGPTDVMDQGRMLVARIRRAPCSGSGSRAPTPARSSSTSTPRSPGTS